MEKQPSPAESFSGKLIGFLKTLPAQIREKMDAILFPPIAQEPVGLPPGVAEGFIKVSRSSKAHDALEAGKPEEALEIYEDLLNLYPNDIAAQNEIKAIKARFPHLSNQA